MSFDPAIHHRRNLRLQGYDYAQAGAYFVTTCTQGRVCLFGEVHDGQMRLNDAGRMVQSAWDDIPALYRGVETDAFVIMPNHIHGIIVLVGAGLVPAHNAGLVPALGNGATTRVAPTVCDIVGAFKSIVTVAYIQGVKRFGWQPFRERLWQRNYYEHIIRNEASLARIRDYIVDNPMRWALDRENPANVGAGLVPAQSMQRENV